MLTKGEAMKADMIFAEERHSQILTMLKKRGKLLVNELCDEFSVSPATIRNDLNLLEKRGALTRTHGGAISRSKVSFEPTAVQKVNSRHGQKKRIASCAIHLIENGDTIALDSGTTTYCLAELLEDKRNITVVTFDISIAALLEGFDGVSVILAGGALRKGFACTTGAMAISALSSLHVDKVFVGANAISDSGALCTPNVELANVKKALIATGNQRFLLCDSSKFSTNSFAEFGRVEEMDLIITDNGLDENSVKQIEKIGTPLEIV